MSDRRLTIAYLGNHEPPHSTENHVRQALEYLGHPVVPIQKGHVRAADVPAAADGCDLLLWTQTYGLAVQGGTIDERRTMLDRLRDVGIPTVGFHLDRWWGLDREDQVREEPFFRVDLLVTADGGHDRQWEQAGVNHVWMPPGVSEFECVPTDPDRHYAAEVAFVGNWTGRYHPEWAHRRQMVRWLRTHYRGRVRMWPAPRQPAVRGAELRKVYASTTVLVGDSCLVGGATRYWSDRIPETLGRGGFLLHPWVDGIDDHFTDGVHLRLWELGDWRQLQALIDHYLARPDEAAQIASAGREHVLEHHTYTRRMRDLVRLVDDRGIL